MSIPDGRYEFFRNWPRPGGNPDGRYGNYNPDGRIDAWHRVCDALDETAPPDWITQCSTGSQSAVEAIRELARRARLYDHLYMDGNPLVTLRPFPTRSITVSEWRLAVRDEGFHARDEEVATLESKIARLENQVDRYQAAFSIIEKTTDSLG